MVLSLLVLAHAQAIAADPPRYVAGEVIVQLGEGIEPDTLTAALGVAPARARRAVPERFAIDALLRRDALRRDRRGRVIVGGRAFASVADVPDAVLFRAAYDAMPPRARALYRAYRVSLPAGTDVETAVATLAASPGVELAEPNYLHYTSLVPSDPRYGEQWSHAATQAGAGWDIETGDPGVRIAIVDTGVDYAHEDLAANIWRDAEGNPGADFVDVDTRVYEDAGFSLVAGEDYKKVDDDPSDRHGHGTHVAGIAAAVGDNGIGVAGVCHHCQIMPVRAGFAIQLGSDTFGALETGSIVLAITWAADNGADVINMSFGSSSPSSVIENAVEYAVDQGVVLVGAAGNSGTGGQQYPASYDGVIGVAATAIDDDRAFYSSFGDSVDIAAPGGDETKDPKILSTLSPGAVLGSATGYGSLQGTSMASPYVAGLAGLLLSHHPTLGAAEVGQIMASTADAPASAEFIGLGRVNVAAALGVAGPSPATAAITTPAAGGTVLPDAGPVDVVGSATGTSYLLELGAHPYAGPWTTIGTGAAVVDGTLGVLDPAGLARHETHYLRLAVDGVYTVVDLSPVYVGWRQVVNQRLSSPTVADLDGDGTREVLVGTHGSGFESGIRLGKVYAWHTDGSPVAGFPVATGGNTYSFVSAPAVGDLEGDGSVEIVHTARERISVLNHDGTAVPPWPKEIKSLQSPTLADLDGDGDLEIIAPAGDSESARWSAQVWAWHHDGTAVDGFPVEVEDASAVAVADLDRDGTFEIVFAQNRPFRNHYRMHVIGADGSPRPNWPQETVRQSIWSPWTRPPTLGDVDNDGDLEVVAALGQVVHVWHHDGTLLPGWPIVLSSECCDAFKRPLVTDLDGDGDLEILYEEGGINTRTRVTRVRAYHHDGTEVAGWPQEIGRSHLGRNYVGALLASADLDGDGDMEVVARAIDRVLAWHHDGTPVAGFPLRAASPNGGVLTPTDGLAGPALADLDGDGTIEIVAPSRYSDVFVFDLPGPFTIPPLAWPMYRRDVAHTGALPAQCGNGMVDPGEDCDDGGESATCNRNCRFAVCGDGVHNATAGEECDGLAAADPGCCGLPCLFAPAGTACDDADACTQVDVCTGGACGGRTEPADGCRAPTKPGAASVTILDRVPDRRDLFKWTGKMSATGDVADLGAPVDTTAYTLCAYDRAAAPARLLLRKAIPAGGTCGTKPCWKQLGDKGFRYKNRTDDDPLDVDLVKLKVSKSGRAVMTVRGKGERLGLPALPLVPAVRVQLHNEENGLCWGADFLGAVSRNDAGKFRAKSD